MLYRIRIARTRGTKSAFQNPNRVEGASRERPIFGEYFCVRAVYSSALDAYSKVLKRALSGAEGIRTPDLRRAKAERRFRGRSPSFEKPLKQAGYLNSPAVYL